MNPDAGQIEDQRRHLETAHERFQYFDAGTDAVEDDERQTVVRIARIPDTKPSTVDLEEVRTHVDCYSCT